MSLFVLLFWMLCLFSFTNGDEDNAYDNDCVCSVYDGPDKYRNDDGSCKYCLRCDEENGIGTCDCKSQSYCAGVYIGWGTVMLGLLCICCCVGCNRKKCIGNRNRQETDGSVIDNDMQNTPAPIVVASDPIQPQPKYQPIVNQQTPQYVVNNDPTMNTNHAQNEIGMNNNNAGDSLEGMTRRDGDGNTWQ